MTLREKQNLFCKLVPRLIDKIYESGYTCSFGDAYAKKIICKKCGEEWQEHMNNSNHYIRLAIDINLFSPEGSYLTDTMSHQPFGEYWESLHELCRWGGRFQDGNHYSIEYNGRR